ncbi:MAG: transcription elongation factor GreB [Proteobacteria bacterium]|nr:transcription elongation factor GreB [Pseudomonadota bacterium]
MSRDAYITPEGYERLRAELHELQHVERPRVTQEVADAAAQGDRSENAEYIYGKKRLREIDGRLRFLMKRMDELTVVREAPGDVHKVFFGAFVTLEDESGASVRYRVVGPDEFDVDRGWISIASPVARALMGREEGDEVVVRRPRGDAAYTIVAVDYGDEKGPTT